MTHETKLNVIRLIKEGRYSDSQISGIAGCAESTVKKYRAALEHPMNPNRRKGAAQ